MVTFIIFEVTKIILTLFGKITTICNLQLHYLLLSPGLVALLSCKKELLTLLSYFSSTVKTCGRNVCMQSSEKVLGLDVTNGGSLLHVILQLAWPSVLQVDETSVAIRKCILYKIFLLVCRRDSSHYKYSYAASLLTMTET